MSDLTIAHARRKLELGIERSQAVERAQTARAQTARGNLEDAQRKADVAQRRTKYLRERLRELGRTEDALGDLP